MDRRRFLISVAVTGSVTLAPWPVGADQASKARGAAVAPECKVLTVDQATTLGAIVEQLIPADDYPGAKEAGVVFYIDGILSGPYSRFYKDKYEKGLKIIDQISQARFGNHFAALDGDHQISTLKALENGTAGGKVGSEFFSLSLRHSMEGYYGNPKNGGNHGGASWKMIGFKG